MVFSYKEKVIIKYLPTKYKFGATRIVNDHPEYESNVNGLKKLLKNIVETCVIARKEVSGRPKSVCTEENVKLIEEIILSQEEQPGTHSTPAEIACEFIIDRRLVARITDQGLDLCPLRTRKVQKLTDLNTEKHIIRSRKLLSKFSQKTFQIAFFSDERIFKAKQLYNSRNDMYRRK